ncbi:hypothetical protein [Desulfoluna butyratoxydans]|uniref:Uncharacterized protein n=1 Tax=Desulfoluna butyratoxydans TaxID=231438 RepID=A0A4U8YUI9_9BACT|nr:hypothetical protein [Desulfoluna butyratoxydans]VFQ47079.1 hypothetical protein MSL71_47650 [Desulfoluna butyratoxydans]
MIPEGHSQILKTIETLYEDLFLHDGHGRMELEMRFLKKGQKEILVRCGKDYRFVVDFAAPKRNGAPGSDIS